VIFRFSSSAKFFLDGVQHRRDPLHHALHESGERACLLCRITTTEPHPTAASDLPTLTRPHAEVCQFSEVKVGLEEWQPSRTAFLEHCVAVTV
jgi:hypothetical protein